jgi:hypothetical protein
VNIIFRHWFAKCKKRINRRLDKTRDTITFQPRLTASNIHYELSGKTHAITCGGIGLFHMLARRVGLIPMIDERLHLFKLHLPYHESDHVLNIAYNAAREIDRSVLLCLRAGFRKVLLRGDTDFSQTEHLDGWNAMAKVRFIFGYDAMPNLVEIADTLPESAWRRLERPARYVVQTQPRQRPVNVKDRIVRERGFETLRLKSEDVAEFAYQPVKCSQSYRMVVVRKNITKEKGEQALMDDIRYFFYITNEREWSASEVVFSANDRCNQENLIAQLKGGVQALHSPLASLESNWAYMVMAALAWNLKAWWALTLPEEAGRWQERHRDEKRWALRLEFRTFLNAFVLLPCQILRTGRKVVYRLLGWNPHLPILFRLVGKLNC